LIWLLFIVVFAVLYIKARDLGTPPRVDAVVVEPPSMPSELTSSWSQLPPADRQTTSANSKKILKRYESV
jgi:hypothetical protein